MTETIKVEDSKGFVYEVDVTHKPHFGFSVARYRGSIIADCQLGRIMQPFGDDDREWEMYEYRLAEWRDEIMANLQPACKRHFNQSKP